MDSQLNFNGGEMKQFNTIVLICSALMLAACSTVDRDHERLPYPNYVSGGFLEDVSVQCGAAIIVVSRHAMDQFYTANDELLTHKQFCDTFQTGSYIKRS
jgi:hypothetical protein